MATLDEIRAARAADRGGASSSGTVLDQIRAARAADSAQARRNQDGTYGQPPEGAYTDPETGQVIDPAQRDARQEMIVQAFPYSGRAQEVVQGAPFVGEYFDEALGAISPQAGDRSRMVSDAFEAQRPGQSMALGVGGGVLASIPAGAAAGGTKAADFIARGGNLLTRSLRAGALAAPAGAAEGAASFAGRAAPGERLESAKTGAIVGGSLGAALGPVASLVGEGAASLVKRVKGLDVRTISDEFGLSPSAARTVREALANDDLAMAQARLAQLGDDAFLADAGPATGALLDASASTGGVALRVASDAVGNRSAEVGKRLPQVLDSVLGKPSGIRSAARGIAQDTSAARGAAYREAYSSAIDYAGDAGRSIEDVISRVPAKTLRQAVDEANDAMRESGARNQQILAEIADDGSVKFSEMLNVEQLDFLKRGLDDVARQGTDQFGRPTGAGARASRLARDLRDAVKAAVPEYARALRVGGDKIQRDEGLDLGRKLLMRATTVEDVKGFLNQGVSQEAREAIRQGMRESIEQNLSNVRRTITDPNVDAREAMQLVKEMSSRANMEKATLALGSVRADRLINELDRSAAALQLRAAISRNSQTAIRQSIQGQVTAEATPGILRRTIGSTGNPLDAAREITSTIAGIDPKSMGAREKAIFDEIAQALVGVRGAEAQRALSVVNRAIQGQPIKDVEAQLIGRVAGSAIAGGSYQSGRQPLAQQYQR